MSIIDAHLHLFKANSKDYPRPVYPKLADENREVLAKQLLITMEKSGVDTVLIAAGQTTGVTLFKQMYSRGYDWTVCVTTDLQTDDFVAGAGNEATQGVFALVPGQVESEESWQRFSGLYEAKFGEKPVSGYYQAETYDAIMVTALAMQASGG